MVGETGQGFLKGAHRVFYKSPYNNHKDNLQFAKQLQKQILDSNEEINFVFIELQTKNGIHYLWRKRHGRYNPVS